MESPCIFLVWFVNVVDFCALFGGFSFLLLVTSCKMKCSVGNLDLAGGEGLTKVRNPLDFGREDLGDAG